MDERAQAELELLFDGEAVHDGRMNVRDLAPSMLAVGALFESANKVLNGTRTSMNVNVKATSSSSFHIVYEVMQSQVAQGMSFQELLVTAVQMKELIFAGAVALFALIKILDKKKPKVEKVNENLFRLTINNQTYEVPLEWLKLYQDISIRRAIADIVRPVKELGIDIFQVKDRGKLIQSVTKADVANFDMPEIEELLIDETSKHVFTIVSLAFKEDNKWRLNDGQVTYSVLMNDTNFQRRVDAEEIVFAKNDILVCDLHTIQWQVAEGIKTEREITKVHKHIHGRQLSLLDWSNNSSD